MLTATVKTGRCTAAPSTLLLNIAREAACAVAESAMTVFGEGRWAPTDMARQAYALTVNILELEAEIGAVCEACFAETRIRAMAQNAHLIIQHARLALASGEATISRILDWQLLDAGMEETLVPAYAIVLQAA